MLEDPRPVSLLASLEASPSCSPPAGARRRRVWPASAAPRRRLSRPLPARLAVVVEGVRASAGKGAPSGGQNIATVMMGDGNSADMLKFAHCMRSHGVGDFPEPSSNGTITVGGTLSQSPQFQAADQTCHKLLPNGGVPTAAQRAQGLDQLLKVSVCMRAHGISDFPDPTANGIEIPIRKGMPTDLDPNNPGFQSAEKACQRFGP